jgi:two-component system sensor histidine kinase BarA
VTASYTELQQKNKELRESFERLKELDRLKSNFLATVSHELRTPLTSVIGYSEMLLEGLAGPLSDEQREYVGTIMEKGEQLLGLISGILDFSKIETGTLRLNPTPTNVVEVTHSAVTTVMPLARKLGITIEFFAEQNTPTIRADADKVRQVLVNILGNAVKFNRKQGKVSVKVGPVSRPSQSARVGEDLPVALVPVTEEFVSVAVADTGVGIPSDKLDRIFDSFYQVDGSSTREYGGTGLGLAITRNLVEAHGGIIEVESEQGKGSTFTVLLPIEQAI